MTIVHQLQDRGKIMIHGSKGSDVLENDATYAAFLIKQRDLHGGGGEMPMLTFVPHQLPQPIGTVVNEETNPSE